MVTRKMVHGLARISTDYKKNIRIKKSVEICVNPWIKILISFILLLISCMPLYAQTEETPHLNYHIVRDENQARFIQRLSWQNTDYVSHYVVIVEQFSQNGFVEIERKETKENFAEVSLAAGQYRYSVEVYDVFEELFHTTNWREFEIIRALQPQVSSFSPGGFYLDEDYLWVVTVHGRNFLPNSIIYLVRGNIRINPESFSADGSSARLEFSEESLIPGKYDVYVRNPGGLDVLQGTFTIGYRKPFDLNISVMYSPIIPVTGFLFFDDELEAPFIDIVDILSAGTRISFVPFKRHWGYLGAEFSASFTYLGYEREYYSVSSFLLNTHISLLYQKYFMKKRLSINAGIGIGISTLLDVVYEYPGGASPSESFSGIYPSFIVSFSGSYFFKRNIYVTAGADYIQMISAPEDGQMPGFVRPFVGVGMQF